MKFTAILPLVAAASAFVLPPDEVIGQIAIEDHHNSAEGLYDEVVATKDELLEKLRHHLSDIQETSETAWEHVTHKSKNVIDHALDRASQSADAFTDSLHDAASDMYSWAEDELDAFEDHHHGGHGGDHHGGHHGRHGRPSHEANETVWQLISGSKYTTKLAELLSDYDDLVDALNSTKTNVTVFAPTDAAFEKIPEHAPKPSKEELKAILSYHVIPDFYPAGRVLASHTAPTVFKSKHLGSEPQPQRLSFKLTLRGLTVNYYSRVVGINFFGTNGVVHGVDSILIPPPPALKIVDLFPGAFSTLELGLAKTGLLDTLNETKKEGSTLFLPTNSAFERLGPRINAFLFSQHGLKYLKALLEYHVVAGQTLYSDAYYKPDSDADEQSIPKGIFHVDLPTLLKDRSLSIDVARYGGFISIKINGFTTVAVSDNVADDGVIHVLRSVLIPPKQLANSEMEQWDGVSELSEEDLMERLQPFVPKTDL